MAPIKELHGADKFLMTRPGLPVPRPWAMAMPTAFSRHDEQFRAGSKQQVYYTYYRQTFSVSDASTILACRPAWTAMTAQWCT